MYYPVFDEIFITVHGNYVLLLRVVDNPLIGTIDLVGDNREIEV